MVALVGAPFRETFLAPSELTLSVRGAPVLVAPATKNPVRFV